MASVESLLINELISRLDVYAKLTIIFVPRPAPIQGKDWGKIQIVCTSSLGAFDTSLEYPYFACEQDQPNGMFVFDHLPFKNCAGLVNLNISFITE